MKKMIFMLIAFAFLLINSGCTRREPVPGEKLSDNQIVELYKKGRILNNERKYQETINLLEPYAEKNAYIVVMQDGRSYFIAKLLGKAYFMVKNYENAVPYMDFNYIKYLENYDERMGTSDADAYFQMTRERSIKAGVNIEPFCQINYKKRIGCIETGDNQYVDVKELADAIGADFRSTDANNWSISFKGKTAKLSADAGNDAISVIIEKDKTYAPATEVTEALGGKATWYEQTKYLKISIY